MYAKKIHVEVNSHTVDCVFKSVNTKECCESQLNRILSQTIG